MEKPDELPGDGLPPNRFATAPNATPAGEVADPANTASESGSAPLESTSAAGEPGPIRPSKGRFAPVGLATADPDRACFSCLIGIAMLVVSALVWAGVYWWMNPEFHPDRALPKTRYAAPTPSLATPAPPSPKLRS